MNNNKLLSFEECWHIRVPNFCEENVWHILSLLRRKLQGNDIGNVSALFITNPDRCVSFDYQRASHFSSNRTCYWDYHVIILLNNWVYDIDSTLPFPFRLNDYINHSFSSQCRYFFRAVSMNDMLGYFSSDRRHMPTNHGNKNNCIHARFTHQQHMLPFFLDVPGLNKRNDHLCISVKEREEVMSTFNRKHLGVLLDGVSSLKDYFHIS